MKYCKRDLILVAVTLFLPVQVIAWATNFEQMSVVENSLMFVVTLCWFWYNAMIATHNFIHTPFFKSDVINKVYMFINSMNMNVPHIMFHYHHLQHHAHNNSAKDPSSTFTYGRNGEQEGWFKYSALAPYRKGTLDMMKLAVKKGKTKLLVSHVIAIAIHYVILGSISFKFLMAYLILSYVAWFFCSLENYFEHYKATDINDRFSNSVSFHSDWYNKLFFNVGFHQEHHIEPQTHWSQTQSIRSKYLEKTRSRDSFISTTPPLLGMLSKKV